MKKFFFTLFSAICVCTHALNGQQPPFAKTQITPQPQTEEEGIVFFNPPAGWMLADADALPGHVRTMVIGKGLSNFPPSLNLSSEKYKGTLKQYLKIVKNMNASQGYEWKDLGTIQTQAGVASLSQVDTKTQWGVVRLMHVILVKNGSVYILTASATKDEFSVFYKEFFAAMRSLKIANDLYDLVADTQQRTQLKSAVDKLKMQWTTLVAQRQKENPQMDINEIQQSIFKSDEFQNTLWTPFKEMLKQKYTQLGGESQSLFLEKIEGELFNLKSQSNK